MPLPKNIISVVSPLIRTASLHLDDNMLTGTLVSELGLLVNLRKLLYCQQLLQADCSVILMRVQPLESLQFSENPSIFGTIPTELGNLESLRSFIAHFASLTGQIPDIFDSMTNLLQLQMPGNFFEGSMPTSIFSLSNLGK